jgi:hypothetical protein
MAAADPATCEGPPTCFVVVRGDRVSRSDGPNCTRCGGEHEVTVTVVRDATFFQRTS